MTPNVRTIFGVGWIAATAAFAWLNPAIAADEHALFASTGSIARPPYGWVDFCHDHPAECDVAPSATRDAVLSNKTWKELVFINKWVNQNIKPMTDLEHYGVVDKWAYPDDGYGDCEDYVLLKRRMLMEAGWPREALLITVVRDQTNDGHAVLTVRTDSGEFVLDNLTNDIVLWSETPYRYVKRQSQSDPNVWISLGDTRPAAVTATSRPTR